MKTALLMVTLAAAVSFAACSKKEETTTTTTPTPTPAVDDHRRDHDVHRRRRLVGDERDGCFVGRRLGDGRRFVGHAWPPRRR